MSNYWDDLRALLKRYEDVPTLEKIKDKEFMDGLEIFCRESKKFTDANPTGQNAPKNPHAGETKRGTSEFDVFNGLSLKRLQKNGVHG